MHIYSIYISRGCPSDAYPMPRVEEFIDRSGGAKSRAKFITTLHHHGNSFSNTITVDKEEAFIAQILFQSANW